MVDLDTHRPIDLLPDREATTVAAWLSRYPTLRVVCRDRAGAYADAATTGAAQAIQVADRWHLWHNLAQHVEKTAAGHRRCIPPMQPPPPKSPVFNPPPAEVAEGRSRAGVLAARTRERHHRIHEHLAAGKGIREIAAELKLSRGTVRRFARAKTVEDLQPGQRRSTQPSILTPFLDHLHQRWADGISNAAQLHAEIQAMGYRGGATIVREYLRPMRLGHPPRPTMPTALTTRQITSVLMRRPGDLDPDEQRWLQHIRGSCPHLDQVARHVTAFATMLTKLQGEHLNAWMAAVDADDQPHLHSFVAGIRRDYDAVRNGLTLQHNSGPVEGHVNRIKMIKRQMYGRANFDLLRKRVLLA